MLSNRAGTSFTKCETKKSSIVLTKFSLNKATF